MNIEYIQIENFKGIKSLRIDFSKKPQCRFYTLIGLNESGKTTILEAINNFCYGPDRMEGLDLDNFGEVPPENMIPIFQRSNFNGAIEISIKVVFSAKDRILLKGYLRKNFRNFKLDSFSGSTVVTYQFDFKNSSLAEGSPSRLWEFGIRGKEGKQRKTRDYSAQSDIWDKSVKFLSNRFPDIIYFPNFLFDFPEKIYLDYDNMSDSLEKNKSMFYCKLFQDILNSLPSECLLNEHILKRMKSEDETDRRNMEAVLLEAERALTKTVFSSWEQIFGKNTGEKRVRLRHGSDDNGCYIQFMLEDTNGLCQISERSLGFRWFLVFRLFTYYRGRRNARYFGKKVLFLLDEPASNLHSTAQTQLLKCLDDLPGNCYMIYTTHSHHLINPKWLENAYVIKNEGISYDDSSSEIDFTAGSTNITATKYRKFVSEYPDQTSYFKPILDVLDYAPSKLEYVNSAVLVEGKNDFYTLNYMNMVLGIELAFDLMPGMGCNKLGNLIQLYIGWGKEFCILLDSDNAGQDSQKKYEEEWNGSVDGRIFYYGNILSDIEDRPIESLFSKKDKKEIFDKIGQDFSSKKKALNRAIQELYIRNVIADFEEGTIDKFRQILDYLNNFFK